MQIYIKFFNCKFFLALFFVIKFTDFPFFCLKSLCNTLTNN